MPLAVVGRGVPVLWPAAVADDAGDLPARPRQVRPAAVRCVPARASCRPTRSRTGSTTRSPPASRRRPSIATTGRLRRMLQVAVQKQKILTNPCDRVDPPRVPKREMMFLDWDQVIRLAEAHSERYPSADLRRRRHRACAGASWSVCGGPRSTCTNRKIRVTEQLVQLEDGSFLRKEPKTSAGVRSITISAATAALLADAHRVLRAPGARSRSCSPNGAGQPLSSSSFLTHHFPKAQAAAGVSCRFHDLAPYERGARHRRRAHIRRRSRPAWATRRST